MFGGLLHFLSFRPWRHVTLHLIISITPSYLITITFSLAQGFLVLLAHFWPANTIGVSHTLLRLTRLILSNHPGLSDPQPWPHVYTRTLTRYNRVLGG